MKLTVQDLTEIFNDDALTDDQKTEYIRYFLKKLDEERIETLERTLEGISFSY